MGVLRSCKILVKRIALPLRLRLALRSIERLVVIVVGANDGKTGDPTFDLIKKRSDCRALLIEPVPHIFCRLQEHYRGVQRVTLENLAVGPSGNAKIYYIAAEARTVVKRLPVYFEELASFDKEKLMNLLDHGHEHFLQEIDVKVETLAYLIGKHDFEKVDLLQIDTEGFDFEVLKTFPFDSIRPKVVCFEHCHLSNSTRGEALDFMRNLGYTLECWGKDYVCII